MPESFFYRQKKQALAVVPSYFLLEALGETVQKNPEVTLQDALSKAVSFVYGKKLSEAELKVLAEAITESASTEKGEEKSQDMGERMGSALMQWLVSLTASDMCHVLSGYSPKKTEELYCFTDYRLVTALANTYFEDRWHRVQADYETAMYGFGGSYKKDKGPTTDSEDSKTIDLTKGGNRGLAQLRQMGF